jgi:hypothetical protein
MIRIRGRSLRLLGLAVLAIVLAPCLIEIGLRVSACRSCLDTGQANAGAEVVPSWTTHHRLAPLQRKRIPRKEKTSSQPAEPVLFRTNSLGLRGHELELPKPPGVFRIILLGDESILGESTDESLTVAARLEHWLQTRSQMRIEVVNAGLPDSCPLLTFLQVRHGLLALQPDMLLVDVNSEDTRDDRRFRRSTELAADGQPLASSHPELSAPKRSRTLSENFLVVRHTEQLVASWLTDTPTQNSTEGRFAPIPASVPGTTASISDEQLSLTVEPLEDLANLAATVPGGLVIATHPTDRELTREARQDSGDLTNRLREFAHSRRLLFCDSTPAFRTAGEKDSLFLPRGELSSRGHEAYARALAVALVERVAGPWMPTRSRAVQPQPERPTRTLTAPERLPAVQPDGGLGGDRKRTETGQETRLAPILEQR